MWDENCFITLTYRDKSRCSATQLKKGHYCPKDGSLNKEHFKKFMKRLRKKFTGQQIRYYHCGEYGDDLDRPHYHAALFNLGFEDQELFYQRDGISLFTSQTLEQLWPYGFSTIGELTYDSAGYIARYCLKKITGDRAQDHYLRKDEYDVDYWLQPEYTTMSRRPGIGATWYEKFTSDVFPADETPVPGRSGQQRVFKKTPRYYEKLLEQEDPELHNAVKEARMAYRADNKEEYTPERLEQRYKVKKAQMKMLKRELGEY